MRLHEREMLSRERFGNHALIRYRHAGPTPEPGQFFMVRPASSPLDPFLPRPLFVHDHEDGVTSLLFEVRGRGTALLTDDTQLLVSEPLGRGFMTEVDGPTALVGGGVWVAPLRLLARRLEERGVAHDVYLEVPAGVPKAYTDRLPERFPEANLVPTRAGDGPEALLGRVGDLSRYTTVYASGPEALLRTVCDACSGRVPAQVAARERMACADGSCHGCAVPVWRNGERTYDRACVEGPVFRAEALAW